MVTAGAGVRFTVLPWERDKFSLASRLRQPQLSYVAHNLLSVPAASTSSEQSFSIAGRTVEERRCQLKRDSVDGLLFLQGLSN